MVGAKHTDSGSELGSPKRNHMFPNVSRHHLPVLGRSIVENPLHKIVAVLVTRNVNQRDSSPVEATFTDTIQISTQELAASYLQTLLHHL
jgi:hypothetical protein